jgi:xanthine/CO dehydrogenase XdhC/CoxF family maturation factor
MTDQHSPPATDPSHGHAAAGHPGADHGDPACDVAHGAAPAPPVTRTLVAVFTSPVASYLLRYAGDAGFRTVLVEPDPQHATPAEPAADGVIEAGGFDGYLDDATDVVVTDHHRPELGPVLRDALAGKTRWVGVMGNPRHPAPHIPALAALGVAETDIGRVHRPIGLNIGSHTPAEIALATLAGLIADRNGRPGGFEF